MKKIPIRMGPLALLLCVIGICMAVLSMLSVANSSADMRLAQRYAKTVETRYLLEEDGQRYLQELKDQDIDDDVIEKEIFRDDFRLSISLQKESDGYHIITWKIEKLWEESSNLEDLWDGD